MTSKELLKKAFLEAEYERYREYSNETVSSLKPSAALDKRMDKLFKKNNRISFSTRHFIALRFLPALLAVIIVFTGVMNAEAINNGVLQFIKIVGEKYTELTVNDDSGITGDTISVYYTISALPYGYSLKQYDADEYGVLATYSNDEGQEILFTQDLLISYSSIDNEDFYEELYINGHDAYLYGGPDTFALTWTDENYWFSIFVPAQLKQDLFDMAMSLEEKY